MAGAMQTSGAFSLPAPAPGRDFHIFCSAHNVGAARLLQEVVRDKQLEGLKVTQAPDLLEKCDAILVYLTSRTWQSGETTVALAREVEKAMDLGVKVILAHEMPGAGQEFRDAIEFKYFFCCEDGATPDNLLKRGIYKTIAVALKGGEWRKVSMVDLAQGLGAVRVKGARSRSTKIEKQRSQGDPIHTQTRRRRSMIRAHRAVEAPAGPLSDEMCIMVQCDTQLEQMLDEERMHPTPTAEKLVPNPTPAALALPNGVASTSRPDRRSVRQLSMHMAADDEPVDSSRDDEVEIGNADLSQESRIVGAAALVRAKAARV